MPTDFSHPSITDLNELPLVRHLVADWHWGEPVLRALPVPENCSYYLEENLGDIGEGDVDLLAVNPVQPNQAVGIQIKRIKVPPLSFFTGNPNKLGELVKLYSQTNQLVNLGFWRTCSCVIAVVDSRENNLGNPESLDGPTPELSSVIQAQLASAKLHPSAGFVYVELVQPSDCAPLTTGSISCEIRRPATEQAQSRAVTEWVERIIATKTPNPLLQRTASGGR